MNISISAYGNYEKRSAVPGWESLIDLADYFCVSIDYLTGRTDDSQQSSYLEKALDEMDEFIEKYFGKNSFWSIETELKNEGPHYRWDSISMPGERIFSLITPVMHSDPAVYSETEIKLAVLRGFKKFKHNFLNGNLRDLNLLFLPGNITFYHPRLLCDKKVLSNYWKFWQKELAQLDTGKIIELEKPCLEIIENEIGGSFDSSIYKAYKSIKLNLGEGYFENNDFVALAKYLLLLRDGDIAKIKVLNIPSRFRKELNLEDELEESER